MTIDIFAFPCSFAQQRLWFLDQLTPGKSVYNIPAALRLTTSIDPDVLRRSIDEMVLRHETLRTTFHDLGEGPMQVIAAEMRIGISVVDLRAHPEDVAESEAMRLATVESQAPFDLAHGPLLRVGLLQLTRSTILLVTMHHIVSDGWSMEVFFRELTLLYDAALRGEASPLLELPVQYADFAGWQRESLRDDVLREHLEYWKPQLAGVGMLQLPIDHPRPAVQTYQGSRQLLHIEPRLTNALKQLSLSETTTLFMTLVAAFNVLLYRYSGQEDIAIGILTSGRNRRETEGLIGFFVNTLVLRTRLSATLSFRELLAQIKETSLAAYAYPDLPFEKLVEELQPERDLGRNPLVQVTFQLFNPPAALDSPTGAGGAGDSIEMLDIAKGTAKFDLAFDVWEAAGGLTGRMEYSTELFDSGSITRMLDHFVTLIEGVVANPDADLVSLPLLSERAIWQQIESWNATDSAHPGGRCIHDFFEEQAHQFPNAIAVICGSDRLTYGELNLAAARVAGNLNALGVVPETLVAVCLHRQLNLPIALLGILKAGGAYLPLDPHYPVERSRFMVSDAQVRFLIAEPEWVDGLGFPGVLALNMDDMRTSDATAVQAPAPRAHNLAYVLFTSGSTGLPKGVAIEHRNTTALIHWAKSQYTRDELSGVLASTSVCFDLSVFELLVTLGLGGTVVLAENALHLRSLPAANSVRLINTVPSAIVELARSNAIPSSVITVNLAGEPLRPEVVKEVFRHSSVQTVYNLYGPTEDTTYSTCARINRGEEWKSTIGRPLPNGKAYILDNCLAPVPVGVTGELYLGGQGVARGYLRRVDLTREKFLESPFVPGTRIYRTGDLARYRESGEIEFLGRADTQVKLRGFRLELGEVEATIRMFGAVEDTAVVLKEDRSGDPRLVAYVVPTSATAFHPGPLRRFLEQRLPQFMIPTTIVSLAALPMTPNGKVDRMALPDPEPLRDPDSRVPRGEVERTILEIWRDVLGRPDVGLADNFFDMGGHSLLMVRAQVKLGAALGEVSLIDLFRYPTIEALAEHLASNGVDAGKKLDAVRERVEKQRHGARALGKLLPPRATGGTKWAPNG